MSDTMQTKTLIVFEWIAFGPEKSASMIKSIVAFSQPPNNKEKVGIYTSVLNY